MDSYVEEDEDEAADKVQPLLKPPRVTFADVVDHTIDRQHP
jgi:hypothetical protein